MKFLLGLTHIALSLCFPLKFSSYPNNRLMWNTLDFYVRQLRPYLKENNLSFVILGHQLFL
jgi:hypothetical protein